MNKKNLSIKIVTKKNTLNRKTNECIINQGSSQIDTASIYKQTDFSIFLMNDQKKFDNVRTYYIY